MQVFNNLAGSGPGANECCWSSQQLEWSAWVEMADYTVLQAKRMIELMSWRCLIERYPRNVLRTEAGFRCIRQCMCTFARCAFHAYVLTPTWLMRARLTTWVRFNAGCPSLLLTLCEWQPQVTLQTLAVCRQCMIGLRDSALQATHTYAHTRPGVNILLGRSDSQQNFLVLLYRVTHREWDCPQVSPCKMNNSPQGPLRIQPPTPPSSLTPLPLPTDLPLTLLFSSFFLLLPP